MKTREPRVSLVTGGTDGIGRAVAVGLARGGDRVLFVGRDAARGKEVLAELESEAPGLEHAFLPADLALLGDTTRLAQAIEKTSRRLDATVFCAGILSTIPEWTAEGFERSFVLNYLSRYLLVRRLLPVLSEAPSGRVVFVANAGVYGDSLDFEDLELRAGKRGLYVAGRTQFANDLLAIELSERLSDTRIEVTCVFPGRVRTSVFRNARGLPWFAHPLVPLLSLGALSPSAAAETPVFLAQSSDAIGSGGRFYGPRREERPVPERARRVERRDALWAASEERVGPYLAPPPAVESSRAGDRRERMVEAS
jgi:NAD(P)-dependent dehydrogenase (short-subunit alcohol dehydrogenase family)